MKLKKTLTAWRLVSADGQYCCLAARSLTMLTGTYANWAALTGK